MPSRSTRTRARTVIRAYVATDEGAARLGEVALVDRTSRVGQTGLVFYDTLFDENAASHIALGDAILPATPERGRRSGGAPRRAGSTVSSIHTDFMIGSPEVDIWGVDTAGNETPILADGDWVSAYTLEAAGRSSAWLERLLWEQEAGGSNPPVPIGKVPDTGPFPL